MNWCKALAFFMLYCLASNVSADIGVSPIVIDLLANKPDAEVAIKNFDTKKNAYVEVTPYWLTNPANRNAPKKRVRHPADGLLVFPAKLMILPGQTQFVRILKTAKALNYDRVYEVDFVPKVATHLVKQNNEDGSVLGVRVIIGYGARVTLRPDSPQPALVVRRLHNKLVIKNTGNTLLNITSCTQTFGQVKKQIPLPGYTLFVGQTLEKTLRYPKPVVLTASCMGKPLGPFTVP